MGRYYNDELYHYGVLGMRWGVHRGNVSASYEKARHKYEKLEAKLEEAHSKVAGLSGEARTKAIAKSNKRYIKAANWVEKMKGAFSEKQLAKVDKKFEKKADRYLERSENVLMKAKKLDFKDANYMRKYASELGKKEQRAREKQMDARLTMERLYPYTKRKHAAERNQKNYEFERNSINDWLNANTVYDLKGRPTYNEQEYKEYKQNLKYYRDLERELENKHSKTVSERLGKRNILDRGWI